MLLRNCNFKKLKFVWKQKYFSMVASKFLVHILDLQTTCDSSAR